MAYSKKISQLGVVLAVLLAVFRLSGSVWAEGSAAPGRSVGHVFLGMDRADVWKILQKPRKTYTTPHGMSLYTEDVWSSSEHTLSIVSERDKVIQVEFDSPRITTTDGLSTDSTFAQVRRRHPTLTVRPYLVRGDYDSYVSYYCDDVRQGIAVTYQPGDDSLDPQDVETDEPDTIIIHRPGARAVPINKGRWSSAASMNDRSRNDQRQLRVIRGWFAPSRNR